MQTKHLSLRIDENLLKKFRIVAQYHSRSANGEIILLIKRAVSRYEREYGAIPLEK